MTGRFRLFPRRMGRDVRAWPMLALLLVVVLVAIGCVLWFMREAMRNEQMAVRGKLTEVYRGHLTLITEQTREAWTRWHRQLDLPEPPPARFERCLQVSGVVSALCFDEEGNLEYPKTPQPPDEAMAREAAELQVRLRGLIQAGRIDESVKFVLERFPRRDATADAHGRLVGANAELLLLETLRDPKDARFRQIFDRLAARVSDYGQSDKTTATMPSAQRRFIMGELRRLEPSRHFSTMAAEELAARYLDSKPVFPSDDALVAPGFPGVWAVRSPDHRLLALLSSANLREMLGSMSRTALPAGISLAVLGPSDAVTNDPIVVPLGLRLPGWRLALSLDAETVFNLEAAKRLKLHVFVACAVIAAMSVLGLVIARGFGRQVALARLKNDLVATVSHELKTPLTAMRALVDTLLDAEKFDEKTTREYLQMLAAENARLSRLIENFLSFSRLERNKFHFVFAGVTPARIVENAVAAFGERAREPGGVFKTEVAPDLPALHADADALATALLNLLDNAWKYSGVEKHLVLRAERHDGSVRFAVEDHGIGLSPREQSRVFERFYQADQRVARTGGGCGLGLSIVSSIVEAHRGRVGVTSESGKGSTFTIEVPIA